MWNFSQNRFFLKGWLPLNLLNAFQINMSNEKQCLKYQVPNRGQPNVQSVWPEVSLCFNVSYFTATLAHQPKAWWPQSNVNRSSRSAWRRRSIRRSSPESGTVTRIPSDRGSGGPGWHCQKSTRNPSFQILAARMWGTWGRTTYENHLPLTKTNCHTFQIWSSIVFDLFGFLCWSSYFPAKISENYSSAMCQYFLEC